ncbi:Sodium/hydrogen exchanger [Operophtera brumata]|uniref:Sodium/hydrogen exchanger n=1 Tax=Operophtera brumata TaxID=104452 RepID=A0A0L7L120_OPEBR|nr:Sodium/hydrogen exchanger [Operophtera brumata]
MVRTNKLMLCIILTSALSLAYGQHFKAAFSIENINSDTENDIKENRGAGVSNNYSIKSRESDQLAQSRSKRSSEGNISSSSEASLTSPTTSSTESAKNANIVYDIGPSPEAILSVTQVNQSSSATPNASLVNPSDAAPLPEKSSAEDEHNSSMAIFFVLCILALGILLIHLMLQTGFTYLPESVVIVFLGALIGMIINLMSIRNIANWRKEEAFSPTAFFLVLLPPIIFESGYNLHKGNFFQNIGSILLFAIVGTAISAFVIGAGIYLLGLAQVVYKLSFVESFAFGSLISAVDPVATVAIFHALDVDPVLNMLVFGESILNDAVAIVLTTAVLDSNDPIMSTGEAILSAINRFWLMFFASAGIGVLFALVSALLLKHVDLRKNPSLEFGMMLVFTYAPYVLAEGIHLSGIMAILFCGIVMSHYTHFNLSTVTQVTMQQTMRTLAFIAETCPALVVWSIILCLLGRAANIFPLALLCNKFREHKITKKMMFIMWFSGSTMPLLKFLRANKKTKRSRSLRKQKEVNYSLATRIKGFVRLDMKYFTPFFTRRFTHQVS